MSSKFVVISVASLLLGWGCLELLSPMAICDGWCDVVISSHKPCSEDAPKSRVGLIHGGHIDGNFDPEQWFEEFQLKDLPCDGEKSAVLKCGYSFRAGGCFIPREWGYVVEYDTVVVFGPGMTTQFIPFQRAMRQSVVNITVEELTPTP